MQYLKQSTASQSVLIGPFVDATDAVSLESGLTIANTDIRLSANGGNIAAKNSGGGTYDEAGYYTITLDATDTATVGRLQLACNMSGALPVYHEFQVLEENVFDAMFAASAGLGTDVAAILVDTGTTLDTKLDNMAGATFNSSTDSLEAIRNRGDSAWTGSPYSSNSGTAQAGASSSITLASGASTTDDLYNGQLIAITGGTGAGQSAVITDYAGSTRVATVGKTWTVTPDATSTYDVYPDDIDVITVPTVQEIADGVWDEATSGHVTSGTFGEQLKNDVDAILVDTDYMQSRFGSFVTNLGADIAAIKSVADTVSTKLGTNGDGLTTLATAAALATVDGNVDSILEDTGTTLPGLLGSPAGADIAADIAAIKAETASILTDTATIGTPAGASVSADIAALKTTADAIETDTQNIQSRLPASLNNGVMQADVQRIKDVALTGDGSGTPFDVA